MTSSQFKHTTLFRRFALNLSLKLSSCLWWLLHQLLRLRSERSRHFGTVMREATLDRLPEKSQLTAIVFSTLSTSELFLFRFRFRSEICFPAPVSQITASELLNFLLSSVLFAREFGVWRENNNKNTKNQRQRPA